MLQVNDEASVVTVLGNRSSSIAGLAAALAKAQGEMAGASKDSLNPHFKARYASLASVWDACRTALSKNGLSVLQPVRADGARVTVTTILAHNSGEWISEDLTVTAQSPTPQGIGSAISYGRRYSLASMVGIAPADDDGEEASRAPEPTPEELPEAWRAHVVTDDEPPRQRTQAAGKGSDLLISEPQAKRFYAIAKSSGWDDDDLRTWLKEVWHLESSKQIQRRNYDDICEAVKAGVPQ